MPADTIYALSSGPPPAAIAVIRISGPQAGRALERLAGRIPPPRQAAFARLRDPQTGEVLDEALALFFKGPASETGEDVAELQVHGSRAVIAAVFAVLARIEGLRLAEPGEFTRRAFENGKLDLTRVEGLADLIYADTQAQRRQALRHLQGLLGDRAERWRRQVIEAQAFAEAGIDFSDESDVAADVAARAQQIAAGLLTDIEAALGDAQRGERLREGLVVAIAGPPNAGKSTLLNRLARREAAIVSPFAGTTRDVIEVHLDLGGYPVTLLDTAGIRESDDPVEREGVARARKRAGEADLILWVEEAGSAREGGLEIRPGDAPAESWLVLNKSDLLENAPGEPESGAGDGRTGYGTFGARFRISAATGEGVSAIVAALTAHAEKTFGSREPALVTRERQRQALEQAARALTRAVSESREDILAEELRVAAQALGRLTGRVDVEDILDVIFRDFCIGK
ncbi:MAG: tRNA uridine-5-carboxymethylaminomethyl(34) synthesis GTPase MnmE [Pseudorhodoplanes sp.]|nr:tRNA uridine-5-carboxymethylaminomethyl(34) synthesis GTPase MnmE [Pseudorhodoplanes sp.]